MIRGIKKKHNKQQCSSTYPAMNLPGSLVHHLQNPRLQHRTTGQRGRCMSAWSNLIIFGPLLMHICQWQECGPRIWGTRLYIGSISGLSATYTEAIAIPGRSFTFFLHVTCSNATFYGLASSNPEHNRWQ